MPREMKVQITLSPDVARVLRTLARDTYFYDSKESRAKIATMLLEASLRSLGPVEDLTTPAILIPRGLS